MIVEKDLFSLLFLEHMHNHNAGGSGHHTKLRSAIKFACKLNCNREGCNLIRTPENERQDSDNKLRVLMVAKDVDSTSTRVCHDCIETQAPSRRSGTILEGPAEERAKASTNPSETLWVSNQI